MQKLNQAQRAIAPLPLAIAYYRVSTAKQGASGLGLEAQQAAVEQFCKQRGYQLLDTFTEVETAKQDARPELTQALRRASLTGATLLVAKLDRLSRNVAFLAQLQDSSQRFIAVDNPEANELTVHILAAVAQAERKAISQRTSDALQAARARGTRLGNPNGAAALRRAHRGNDAAVQTILSNAQAFAEKLRPEIEPLAHLPLSQIALALNSRNVLPRAGQGYRWHPASVRKVLLRLAL